mmetsp:Transcript_69257/g.166077  ORF Transcript_69257/g.166077 Transcript_69257/m.166077 type:complete len:214 (+) Transcript_69257:62-703(+)|eukprot:CAMPEP_0178384240 /NCGR_PEP_ID=MMETSP0689_2-20121128/7414_1 /TAXON_ID=160604 /ORGANISM="Amphidinium massartii, Strain CS-259" /LENGTH=213 /DNA_ID=CAMNT_0020004483 /DNA_START=53 /DNA_END=694 /DNA_ORIENTATION=-
MNPLAWRCCCVANYQEEQVLFPVYDAPVSELQYAVQATAATAGHRGLRVPAEFNIASSIPSSSSASAAAAPAEDDEVSPASLGIVTTDEFARAQEMGKLERLLSHFVSEFFLGVFLDAVLEDGSTAECRCEMNDEVTYLEMQVGTVKKRVSFTSIQEIRSGRDLNDLVAPLPLDDLCVTLVMSGDSCVSFKFPDAASRDYFVTCMKVLRLAKD